MPHSELHHLFDERRREAMAASPAETARVATTATTPDDEVFVTLPYSNAPDTRISVQWRAGVQFINGVAQPQYPTRGDEGIVIEIDTGEAWLIW